MSLSEIMEATAEICQVPSDVIVARSKSRVASRARQAFMYVAVVDGKHSATAVGRYLSRDHSTVLHGCSAVRERMRHDARQWGVVRAIRDMARGVELPDEEPINHAAIERMGSLLLGVGA